MTRTLTFFHTSAAHVDTFNRLLAEVAPDIPVQHIVDESLLVEAKAAGTVTPQLAQRAQSAIVGAIDLDAAVVLCTCSTIGGCAELVDGLRDVKVMRVDRPMAEQAVALGQRIVLAATLASTLGPTRSLILDAAERAQKEVEIIELLCDLAWAMFERGDVDGYLIDIARRLQDAAMVGDVIVLAQASMAGTTRYCADLPVPVLSSPRLGLHAALDAYHTYLSRYGDDRP